MVVRKIGFLFPGQGAQYVGMGKEAAGHFETVRKVYEQANEIAGYPLSRYCFEGPEETLTRTLYAQPLIFTTSLALFYLLEEKFPELKPSFVAGLSLGEFSALAAAGSVTFSEGLSLVRTRAESMEQAAQESQGTMVSVLGLTQAECESIAKQSGTYLANLNAPDQFVLSGEESSIKQATAAAEGKGAKRVLPLKVNGAFHSPLMKPARQKFTEALKSLSISKPKCLFVPNATATSEENPERIRTLLAEQLTSPVQWIATMQFAKGQGIQHFIELGPGRVLKGLAKRIDPTFEVFSFEKISDLEALESALMKV